MSKTEFLTLYKIPPLIYSKQKKSILDYDTNTTFSIFPNIPLLKYGFYYFIHQTKDKMEIFEKPEYKTKDLHKIVNPFEDYVPQEEFSRQFKNDKVKSSDDKIDSNFSSFLPQLKKQNPDIAAIQLVLNLKREYSTKDGIKVKSLKKWLEVLDF
jgi:hypothetical protein